MDWHLEQLDASIDKYKELRHRLEGLAPGSDEHDDVEGELRAWVLQVKLNAADAYKAIDRLTDEPVATNG